MSPTWLKLKNAQYLNMDNGHMMGVRNDTRDPVKVTWRVWVSTGLGQPQHTAEDGYETEKDAQNALDEFMNDSFVQVSPPVTDEETGTDKGDDE